MTSVGRAPENALMTDLLVQYGVVLVFAWVFAVQAGMPVPAGPMLLGAGVLSGSGQMNLAPSRWSGDRRCPRC